MAAAISTTARASVSRTPATPTRASWPPSRRRPRSCCTGNRTSSSTNRACASTSGCAARCPGGRWAAFPPTAGAEAVEAAVKRAGVPTGRAAIIAFRGGFHGRTAQTMALTSAKNIYRGPFEQLPGSVYHAAFPYCYRAAGGPPPIEACTCDWEEGLDLLFHQLIFPERVAAVIVEPVLGEGGYVVPPPTFLPRLRGITRRHGSLLIADEVQTGFGRTGEMV